MRAKDSGREGPLRWFSRAVLGGVLASGVGGCAFPTVPAERPDDFSLAITVFRPEVVPIEEPIETRDARFIIEADGALRAEFGPRAREMAFPRRVRRLRPEQLDAVWARVVEADLLGLSPEGRIPGPEVFSPDPASGTQIVVETMADGRRRTVVRTLEGEEERVLLDDLGNFVWVRGLADG